MNIKASEMKQVIVSYLAQKGYSLTAGKDEGKGFSPFHIFHDRRLEVELSAVKDGHTIFILAIGYPSSYDAANLWRYEGFFRLAALDTGHINDSIVIAVPSEFKNSFIMRKQNMPSGGSRKGKGLPDITVYFVDVEHGTVEEHGWFEDN